MLNDQGCKRTTLQQDCMIMLPILKGFLHWGVGGDMAAISLYGTHKCDLLLGMMV